MTNDSIQIHDAQTDEIIIREMTVEEQAKRNEEVNEWLAKKEAKKQAEIEAQEKKTAAQAKLAALGLTTEDLKALGL